MVRRSSVRGLGLTLDEALSRSRNPTAASVPPPLKWTGGKGHERYIRPLRQAYQNTGGGRRIVEPFVGGMNVALNVAPGQRGLLSDADPMLVAALNAMKNKELELDWSPFLNDEGVLDKRAYYEKLRGGTPRGRKRDDFDVSWPPQPNSLNAILDEIYSSQRRPELDPDAVKRWLMYQNLAWRGLPRMNPQGYANYSMNDSSGFRPETTWDYSHFSPLMSNYDITAMPFGEEYIKNTRINPEDDFIVIDPPYMGEESEYGASGFDLQRELARWATRQADEGTPLVVFNSPNAMDLYDGLDDVFVANRPDLSAASAQNRKDKGELVGLANVGMREKDWLGKAELMQTKLFDMAWDSVFK